MKIIDGGVTAAEGFQAAGLAAGIKKGNTKDMALVYSEKPCVAAGTFTTNVVKAAPVKWDQHIVYEAPTAQAIVCNSGVANACTGEEGMGYCKETAEAAAKALNIDAAGVLVGSTGVIGMQLPMQKLVDGIQVLAGKKAEGLQSGHDAALAIMTTDTVEKEMVSYIQQNFTGKISLREFGEQFHLSEKYISRYFKEHFHITLSQYVTYLRLEHAKQLLQDTDFPVTDVAMQSGYQNVSYFIRSFQKAYAVSPLKYRKNNYSR